MNYDGSDLLLFSGGKSIAGSKSCTLSVTAETVDVSSKDVGGGWDDQDVKKLAWEMGTENLFTDSGKGISFDDLFALMVKKVPIDMIFSIGKDTKEKDLDEAPDAGWTPPTTGLYKGKAIITDLKGNAPNGDKATYTATFKGKGALTQVPVKEVTKAS